MISVCFRLDDPSPVGDKEVEQRILEIFARRNIPLCVAAIPFAPAPGGGLLALSRQNAGHLLDALRAGTIEIAQHGHSQLHRGTTTGRGTPSEFLGVPLAEQTRLITEGMAHLASFFGHQIKGFVPPWNTYDDITMQALVAAGFEFVSAGPEVVKFDSLPVVPATCTLHNVRRTAERALYFQSLDPLLVVVFHPDDFEEFKFPPLPDEPPPFTKLRELEVLLDWIKSTPWIRTEALGHIAESVRSGKPLRNPNDVKLPYRVRAVVPPILARSSKWMTGPGILWGALRSRYHSHSPVQKAMHRVIINGVLLSAYTHDISGSWEILL